MKTKSSAGLFRLENVLPWLFYGVGALLLMIMQTAPRFFPVIGFARPTPLILFVICVAIFEGPYAGAAVGVWSGVLWDLYAFRVFGFNALLLLAIGVTVGLLVQWLLRANFLSGMLLCASGVLFHMLLEWLLCYALFLHEQTWQVLWRIYLPNAVYTLVLAPLMYWLVLSMARFIRRRKNA